MQVYGRQNKPRDDQQLSGFSSTGLKWPQVAVYFRIRRELELANMINTQTRMKYKNRKLDLCLLLRLGVMDRFNGRIDDEATSQIDQISLFCECE